MRSLLDLPFELRLMIYDYMTDDLNENEEAFGGTRLIHQKQGQWFSHPGINTRLQHHQYKEVGYREAGLQKLVQIRPVPSFRRVFSRILDYT